ncbi:MAG: hypothetical protein LC676_19955 [Loktanella sp.]|nr:hypothetical protein [Loktanella sp.]
MKLSLKCAFKTLREVEGYMQFFLRAVCWIGSAYFFWLANFHYGFPPDWAGSAGISLVVSLALFLLPFAQEFSLSRVFSFKAKVNEVKKEVADFRLDMRNQLNQQHALLATAVNIKNNNSVSLHIPGQKAALDAEEKIFENRPDAKQRYDSDSDDALAEFQAMDPVELATTMAGLRIRLETELRSYFGYSTHLKPVSDRRFISLSGLWKKYLNKNPDKFFLDSAVRFVKDVGNAVFRRSRGLPSKEQSPLRCASKTA